ncbi:MAG: conjugal transfer protein, partial [Proteobacteria bacterium]|nr:conjugal transfer protein [Pseudomonadota bacterium]
VDEASRRAPTGQRISFRYEWLKRDLALVQRGVDDHLDAPRQPRAIPPLRGEYRQ